MSYFTVGGDIERRTVEEKAATSFFNKKNVPQHIAKRTGTKYGSMPLFELKDKGMWNPRIERIISCLPSGAWIAGGFLRAMIGGEGEDGGDIDFFFREEAAFNKIFELIKSPSSREAEKAFNYYNVPKHVDKLRIVDCESAISFRPNIQLVRVYWFESPEHVIDSFDFTACQFITDGKTLWFGPQSFEDVKAKQIKYHRETGDAIASLNRILKYQNKGYKIVPDLFSRVEKDVLYMLNSPDEMAQHFYQDKIESEVHKHDGSYLQRAWDYLETAPLTRSACAKALKKKRDKEPRYTAASTRKTYSYDVS